jgi:tetratricopeptide (TPR) repeat protein
MNKKVLCFALSLYCCSCTRVPDTIEPKIDYAVQDRTLQELPPAFTPLTTQEKKEAWGQEALIAKGFAKDFDFYQAITGYKRALYLIPSSEKQRKLELDYEMLLCYYIAKKYEEVIKIYESTDLHFVNASFPVSHDLLIILIDSYNHMKQTAKATQMLGYLQHYYPEAAEKLRVATYLEEANIAALKSLSVDPSYSYLSPFLSQYEQSKKSVSKAQILNTFLPGAGYLYIGQKQSALTAFLLNGLFIGASYYFFHVGNVPAGIIFAGFESGWYFGGVYGVGQEAKFYNERVYERCASPVMNEQKLFPILSLQHAF